MLSSPSVGVRFERFIDRLVESGRYDSRSDVVCRALHLLEDHEKRRSAAIEKLANLVEEGTASGSYKPLDEVFDRLDAKYKRMTEERGL